MQIVRDAPGLAPFAGGVLVPTMGALHAGHRALIEHAASLGAPVIVSLFVNPTQFNEHADFERYPRTPVADFALCREAGAACVFAPGAEVIYPPDLPPRRFDLPSVATEPGLEDAHRPGHFAGVYQVCHRLFELTQPRRAVFGEKDWQQLALVRELARVHFPGLEIVPHPTVREPDGLAMSSRNALLTPNHRRRAVALSRALAEASRHSDPEHAERAGRRVLLASLIRPEYFVVRDGATLGPPQPERPARALVAARVGDVRLIDNAPWPGFELRQVGVH